MNNDFNNKLVGWFNNYDEFCRVYGFDKLSFFEYVELYNKYSDKYIKLGFTK